jgi:hypothetical protein
MLAFFTRSARFENAPAPSKAWQAWNLWGGTPARDALRMDPMICAPCVNPRDARKYVRGMLDDLCARSNPPRSMPRTAEGARTMLAHAYDDAIGRAREGAFKNDKARTAAALEDAARYAYGLGMYGPAPAVPYDLLDRMRPPADPRQPELFARANPAQTNAIAFFDGAARIAQRIADLHAGEGATDAEAEAQARDTLRAIATARANMAIPGFERASLWAVATTYQKLSALLAHMDDPIVRYKQGADELRAYLARVSIDPYLLSVADELNRRTNPRARTPTPQPEYRPGDRVMFKRGKSKPYPVTVAEPYGPGRPAIVLAGQRTEVLPRDLRPLKPGDDPNPPRPAPTAIAANEREQALAAARRSIAAAYARGVREFRNAREDKTLILAQSLARGPGEEIVRTYDAEDRALGRPSYLAEMSTPAALEYAARFNFWEPVTMPAAAPDPAPVPPLVALGAQVEAAATRADAAADDYADALRARDALSARMDDKAIKSARARNREKKPAPAPAPSKPAAPLRPVTGKAREVLARLGASVVSLADVARVGCTDDPGARRIMAALTRSGAAMPAGPGAWSLDPARLDECPPARPRTREPRPVCVGECGRWTPARGPSRPWLAALGPTSTIYDSEGRGYPVRWALARLDALGALWHASNFAGRADPKYDRELQARERGTTASRAQVEKIAGSLSLAQWVAPSSTPADSAPVVWIDLFARGHVVSGNGRTAAFDLARPSRLAVAETVGGRWKIPKTLRAALEAADLVPIRIMGEAGEIDRAAAVLLAGASQASASGSLTQTERALSVVRALGLSVADMPALDWPEALTVPRLIAFIAANRPWAAWATAPLAPERAILLSSDPLALTVHFRDVLIGLLPPEAREGGIGGLSIDRALVGALPGIWTLETRIRDGRAPAAWSLVAVLPEARTWAAKSAGRLKEIAADAATDERQAGLFGPARLDTAGARLLAVALGGALARASGRTDPEAAGAEMVAALLAAAPDPSQPSLLGIDDTDPVEVLARKARLSLPRSNPPGRDLARLSDAARRWHWGRYKQAKSARVDRAAWQPSQGFALGELAAISLGADRLEVPPGHLLCATDEGDEADLFVVPPLPLGSLAPRPLRAIEYLADKAGDGPSWYVHDFDPAYPQATTKGGALAIIRKGSRFSIDPARGIVG